MWDGAPALFDMRDGTISAGFVETMSSVIGYAQVGEFLDLPTHAYLVVTDLKLINAQTGTENASCAVLGMLS